MADPDDPDDPDELLTREAGGRYTDRTGGQRLDAGGGLYSDGLLHDAITACPRLRPADWRLPP